MLAGFELTPTAPLDDNQQYEPGERVGPRSVALVVRSISAAEGRELFCNLGKGSSISVQDRCDVAGPRITAEACATGDPADRRRDWLGARVCRAAGVASCAALSWD